MNTNNRNYKTTSIPLQYAELIPQLKSALSKEKGVNVSGGEAVGIAIQAECQRLGV